MGVMGITVENFHTFSERVRVATIELIGAQVAFQEHIIQDMNSDPEMRGTDQVANEIALKRKYKAQKQELCKLLSPREIDEITQTQRKRSLTKQRESQYLIRGHKKHDRYERDRLVTERKVKFFKKLSNQLFEEFGDQLNNEQVRILGLREQWLENGDHLTLWTESFKKLWRASKKRHNDPLKLVKMMKTLFLD